MVLDTFARSLITISPPIESQDEGTFLGTLHSCVPIAVLFTIGLIIDEKKKRQTFVF